MLPADLGDYTSERLYLEAEALCLRELCMQVPAPGALPRHVLRRADVINMRKSTVRGAAVVLSHMSLTRQLLNGLDLRGAELIGADLSGATCRSACLAQANMTDAKLVGADLTRAVLDEARMGGADLSDANLEGASLRGVDLRGVRLPRRLDGVDLTGACGSGLDWSAPTRVLAGACMARMDLGGATLSGQMCDGLDLTGARMAGLVAVRVSFAQVGGAGVWCSVWLCAVCAVCACAVCSGW